MKQEVHPITFEDLLENTKTYVETNVDLLKLKFVEKTTSVTSSFVSFTVIAAFILITLILLSVGLAIWLGKMLGEYYYGFYIVAGFFALLIIIISIFKNKWLKKPIANSFIESISK